MERRWADVREFFTMREARARATRVPEPEKDDLSRALRRATESRAGAEALWTGGAPALALRLAKESWTTALEAARSTARVDGGASLAETLGQLGLSEARRSEVLAADTSIAALPLPATDAEVTAEHANALPRLDAALAVVLDAAEIGAMREPEFARARRVRLVYALAAAAALLAVLIVSVRVAGRTTATASAVYSAKYEPMRVVDGNHETEWLLPDGTAGFIDLHLGRRRAVQQLRLLNTHNYEFRDRATREFRVELWDGARLVKTFDGAFEAFTATPKPVTFPVSSDGQKVTRIRIQVKNWFLQGGGLAEVWID